MERSERIINQYNNLMEKVGEQEDFSLLTFCQFVDSDDENLYKEFKGNEFNCDVVINLLAKRYNLDPVKDIKQIAYIFYDNAYNYGFSYHIANSANYESIMKNGLNNTEIKTEEQQDLEYLKSLLHPDTFKKLLIFYKESKNNLFYSRNPRINVRYGYKPEWIQELSSQDWMFEDIRNESEEAYIFIQNLIEKYNTKYADTSRILIAFPNSYTYDGIISKEKIDKIDDGNYKKAMMGLLYFIKEDVNASTPGTVDSSDLIVFDCDTKKIRKYETETMIR